jgi:tRNA(Ile)-lysidine synthase
VEGERGSVRAVIEHPNDTHLADHLDALLERCMFPPPGTTVRCGLSGGADSTALTALAVAAGCDVIAVHAHHGTRPDADRDAETARRSAFALDVPFTCVRLDLDDGPNLEARARTARLAALGADALTGHTADDLAETVLLALVRGAGARGISAISPGLRHPVLALRRAETRALCERLELPTVEDPSNTDPRFRRNRIRHEVLPLLDDIARKDVTPNLVRTAGLVRDDDVFLDLLAEDIDPTDAKALARAPLPLARRAVRRWLTVDGLPPDTATVARVLDVAGGRAIACEVGGGRRVERTRQQLRLSPRTATGR